MADDDALLRLALHVDDGLDANEVFLLLEALHDSLYAVGYLLVVVEEYLLADDLGDEEAGGLVGPRVLVEVGGRLRQQLLDARQHLIHAELMQGGDGEDLGLRQDGVPFLHLLGEDGGGVTPTGHINLIDQHEDGDLELLHFLEEDGVLVGRLHHVGDVEQHVCILQGTLRELEHLLLQLVVGLQHAGRVGEADLHLGRVEDAHNAVARGLCLEGGNADALAHEEVHERALTHIRVAYDIDETRLMHGHGFQPQFKV